MLRQASEPALTRDKSKLNDYDDDANYDDDNLTQDDTILSIKKIDNTPRRKYGSIESTQKVISTLPPAGFNRNLSIRKSVFKGSHDGGRHSNEDSTRRDPVGSSTFTESDESDGSDKSQSKYKLIELVNDGDSLGIHVVPDYDSVGLSTGLLVHNVDVHGKIGMDGRIREMDKIVEINGQSLSGIDFSSAQNILREAMNSEKLCLKILPFSIPSFIPSTKLENSPCIKHKTAPIPSTPGKDLVQTTPIKPKCKSGVSMPHGPFSTPGPRSLSSQFQKKMASTCSKINLIQQRNGDMYSTPRKELSKGEATPSKSAGFFRSSTKKMKIHLSKGCYGLGFSITTRDVPTGRNCPIYIKHILPQGAAISDGKLQPGDKLLKVNGLDVSKKVHDEVVAYLRGIKLGGKVELLIERSSDEGRSMTDGQRIVCDDRTVEYLVISLEGDIGIGMSVRGKTKQEADGTSSDLGLFVKTIHPEGAAFRDGRLRVDDRITEANGESLVELSNAEAREMLKDAMQLDGPSPQTISFVIERFKDLSVAFSAYPITYQEKISRCNLMTSEVSQILEDTITEGSSNERPTSAKKKFVSCKEKRNENNETLNKEDGKEQEDLDLTNSNLSPIQSYSAPTFSRMAPARQSMSEKRKAQFDPRHGFINPIKLTRTNAQDHDETQITLKKALSAESLVSHKNNTVIKTPQINTRTCGLMKEVLKKYTSVENMNLEIVASHDPLGKEKAQSTKSKTKDGSDSSEHGKKKFRNIFKGLNIFKSKQKKENKQENKTNDKRPSPPSHKMIDNLLNEKMRHNLPHHHRNKFDRPLSSCVEQDVWNDLSDAYNRFAIPNYHYSQQSSLQSAYIPPPPMYGSKACYCDSYACRQSYQPRYYPQDFSHCRTSSRSYFHDPYAGIIPYYHQDINYAPMYSQEIPRKMRHPSEMFYDDDFDEDLNNTISTIHHF